MKKKASTKTTTKNLKATTKAIEPTNHRAISSTDLCNGTLPLATHLFSHNLALGTEPNFSPLLGKTASACLSDFAMSQDGLPPKLHEQVCTTAIGRLLDNYSAGFHTIDSQTFPISSLGNTGYGIASFNSVETDINALFTSSDLGPLYQTGALDVCKRPIARLLSSDYSTDSFIHGNFLLNEGYKVTANVYEAGKPFLSDFTNLGYLSSQTSLFPLSSPTSVNSLDAYKNEHWARNFKVDGDGTIRFLNELFFKSDYYQGLQEDGLGFLKAENAQSISLKNLTKYSEFGTYRTPLDYLQRPLTVETVIPQGGWTKPLSPKDQEIELLKDEVSQLKQTCKFLKLALEQMQVRQNLATNVEKATQRTLPAALKSMAPHQETDVEELIDMQQVLKILKISQRTYYRNKHLWPVYKIGSKNLHKASEIKIHLRRFLK